MAQKVAAAAQVTREAKRKVDALNLSVEAREVVQAAIHAAFQEGYVTGVDMVDGG